MEGKNYLGNTIEIAADKAKYDTQVKKILSDKDILAWILKYCVAEMKACTISEIVDAIEGEPQISDEEVYPGKKHIREAITGLSTEDAVPGEGAL